MSLFQQLDSFPPSCIYALVDESAKSMYVHFSTGVAIQQLSKTIMELKKGIHDSKSLQDAYSRGVLDIRILKVYDSPPPLEAIIRLECVELLRSLGYSDIRGLIDPSYFIKTRVMTDYRRNNDFPPLVYVLAKSTGPASIVMGIFDHMIEADSWIEETYSSFPGQRDTAVIPQFALNERTREYHELHGYKLLRNEVHRVRD